MAGEINFGALNPHAVLQGAQGTNALLHQFAQDRAGKLMAGGDTAGAAKTLMNNGDIAEGQGLIDQQTARGDAETARNNKALVFQQAQDAQQKALDDKAHVEQLGFEHDVAAAIQGVVKQNGAQAALPAFEQLLPVFQHRKVPQETLDMIKAQLQDNPEAYLDATVKKTKDEIDKYTFLNNPDGSVIRGNTTTGEADQVYKGDKIITAAPDANVIRIPGTGGIAAAGAAPHASAVPSHKMGTQLASVIPGVVITGYGRDPKTNAAVGGVEDSMHLDDEALDFKLPKGVTADQAKAALIAKGLPVTEWLDEPAKGDQGAHIHWGWRPKDAPIGAKTPIGAETPIGGGVQILQKGQAKAEWEPASAAEAQKYGAVAGQINRKTGEFRPTPESADGKAPATGAGGLKVSTQTEKDSSKYREAANVATNGANLMEEFVRLNREVKTGGAMAIPGVSSVLGAVNPKIARMNQILAQLTPAMRNGLPGAASDKDVAMFQRATVGPDKPIETNEAAATAAKAFAARQNDYVAYIEAYGKQHGNLLGAQEAWTAYTQLNPLFTEGTNGMLRVRVTKPWRQVIDMGTAAVAAPPAGGNLQYDYIPGKGLVKK